MEKYQLIALKGVVGTVLMLFLVSTVPFWIIFQARNPTANSMTYFTHFKDVMTLKQLDEFQSK